ncbi:hypothetical protein K469DRAFT_720676 [Zopfia rhizophila CBS 207.26]|uniref:Uncharacterized protein n=1 Tax=Zopfia rhizophila CBS 207.26 TaxID=1314779 RepID=A0A6A6DIF4_9PEZI|nr:hypothetical protein K469DRAFT_720676 [Zopfia rhizophila CBS 207.26]
MNELLEDSNTNESSKTLAESCQDVRAVEALQCANHRRCKAKQSRKEITRADSGGTLLNESRQ